MSRVRFPLALPSNPLILNWLLPETQSAMSSGAFDSCQRIHVIRLPMTLGNPQGCVPSPHLHSKSIAVSPRVHTSVGPHDWVRLLSQANLISAFA